MPLAAPWEAFDDEHGRTYYHNPATDTTTWDFPGTEQELESRSWLDHRDVSVESVSTVVGGFSAEAAPPAGGAGRVAITQSAGGIGHRASASVVHRELLTPDTHGTVTNTQQAQADQQQF